MVAGIEGDYYQSRWIFVVPVGYGIRWGKSHILDSIYCVRRRQCRRTILLLTPNVFYDMLVVSLAFWRNSLYNSKTKFLHQTKVVHVYRETTIACIYPSMPMILGTSAYSSILHQSLSTLCHFPIRVIRHDLAAAPFPNWPIILD